MIYGPCASGVSCALCTDSSKCTKHYLDAFSSMTIIEEDDFVKYRGKDYGRSITIRGMNMH